MKTTLYYRNAAENADKVYEVRLEETGGGFVVDFYFGKRGAKLAQGTKTRIPVSLALAENIFAKLVKQKKSCGYTEASDGQPFGGDAVALGEILPHPSKEIVNLATMRNYSPQDYLIQRKMDGSLARRDVAGATLLGELVTARSGAFLTAADKALIAKHGSFFAAFTVEAVAGENMLNRSTRERWGILCSYVASFPADVVLCDTVIDVEACMASGAEGVVAHAWGGTWADGMLCHKAESIYFCTVTAIGGTQSAEIRVEQTGATCRVKMGGGAIDRIRVGSRVRIAGMGLTDAGKIRQPTLCREYLAKF
jgi:predicted DNA-binding WGR domain protein